MTRRRATLGALGLAALVAGELCASGPPRLTLLNSAIQVHYPWTQGAAGVGAAVGAAFVAAAAARRWLRVTSGVVAALLLIASLERLLYRLEANDRALVSRGLLGKTVVPWWEVGRVETGPAVIVVWGQGESQVRINTSDFAPDQRATLERTVSRRVRENSPALDRR